MRIRKCALKLLGSTIAYFSPPPPELQQQQPSSSPEWDSHAASVAAAAAGILCQLNRSPWDLIPNEQNVVSQENEDADPIDDDGIKGARKPFDPPLIKSGVRKKVEEEEEEKKVKKKVKRKRMEKGMDSTVATETDETATPLCKKSDGKGWHCKRPAHLSHSLCQYHLTQLRSYTNNNNHRKALDQATGGGDKHRKKRKADIAGDGNNFYYYYYYGFGPWRGKRRGSSCSSDNFGNVTEEEGRGNSESADGHNAPVMGDDEEDSEEEDGGKGCCNEEDRSDDDDEEEEEEEKRNCRKRGRKPVKARSLKSLL
ncbi:uncharacterized protein [Elaeis guineensis]|uniref:uncharacterized protein n=1 Tax=Elaeis guineensis var. tenera TaxID=51953 RepID=UPI003C6D37E5